MWVWKEKEDKEIKREYNHVSLQKRREGEDICEFCCFVVVAV